MDLFIYYLIQEVNTGDSSNHQKRQRIFLIFFSDRDFGKPFESPRKESINEVKDVDYREITKEDLKKQQEEEQKKIQKRIDKILDKLAEKGYDSLTEEEKRILFEDSKKIR